MAPSAAGRTVLRSIVVLTVTFSVWASIDTQAQTQDQPARARRWPGVLVVHSPLREVLEEMWDRSPTFRQECAELAEARAVVVLQWGATDSQWRARTGMQRRDGVIVATISVPTGSDTVELVAHEVHHVIEAVRGLDHKAEADKPGSGVWRTGNGVREEYETQAAIAAGLQVATEVHDKPRPTSRKGARGS